MPVAMADVSSRPTPNKIIRPFVISPVTVPSTITRARLTRWTTARIFPVTKFFPTNRQDANQLCVIPGGQHLLPMHDSSFDSQSLLRLLHQPQRCGRLLVADAHF